MKKSYIIYIILVTIFLAGCGCGGSSFKFEKSPVDILIRDMDNVSNFTIILHDMDYIESDDKYKHQYKIIKELPEIKDSLVQDITEWYNVSDELFMKHQEDMGMEIAYRKDGIVKKAVAPPGYSQYVGNEKYGSWQTNSSGGSFWAFYGQYMFMSSMFNMMMFPARMSYYNSYMGGGYYGSGRSYYGSNRNGSKAYGTNSKYNSSNKSSKWNSKPSSFKQNVRSKVSRSVSAKRSNPFKTTRSGTRFGSGGGFRSRGGGFGK